MPAQHRSANVRRLWSTVPCAPSLAARSAANQTFFTKRTHLAAPSTVTSSPHRAILASTQHTRRCYLP